MSAGQDLTVTGQRKFPQGRNRQPGIHRQNQPSKAQKYHGFQRKYRAGYHAGANARTLDVFLRPRHFSSTARRCLGVMVRFFALCFIGVHVRQRHGFQTFRRRFYMARPYLDRTYDGENFQPLTLLAGDDQ